MSSAFFTVLTFAVTTAMVDKKQQKLKLHEASVPSLVPTAQPEARPDAEAAGRIPLSPIEPDPEGSGRNAEQGPCFHDLLLWSRKTFSVRTPVVGDQVRGSLWLNLGILKVSNTLNC